MSIEKEIHIRTKKDVFVIMAVIIAIFLTISTLFFYWWMGLLLAILIDYFIFKECYPSISSARAAKVMRSTRVYHSKDEKIPCPMYVIRSMNDKNLELHDRNKDYRWSLTTSPEFFENQKTRNQQMGFKKVEGVDCFFFTEKCFSDAYIKQEEEARKMRRYMRKKIAEENLKVKRIY